ncbi:DUF5988 family protein [Amycolatopsis jiangsuensis]|uniref:Uncharacterized protein n=1 Tax=Amycolatopsis jiangsuensis TaxID=1181879 RepID=A0A840J737_9PSEU|nr:DUF5988 family protein [Amycolatopsis jiangsuensis]MBB4689234.1 hypothetical protein [Amycolatopsis jiangsuensis]
MTDIGYENAVESTVAGTLEGGPDSIPGAARVCAVTASQDKVKVAHLGGYEHFERIPGPRTEPVFRWTMRTKAAE